MVRNMLRWYVFQRMELAFDRAHVLACWLLLGSLLTLVLANLNKKSWLWVDIDRSAACNAMVWSPRRCCVLQRMCMDLFCNGHAVVLHYMLRSKKNRHFATENEKESGRGWERRRAGGRQGGRERARAGERHRHRHRQSLFLSQKDV